MWVEPVFAEANEWHGLRRLRLRALLNTNIQELLIGAGQNLKRFQAATGWGRRNASCGSLVSLRGSATAPSRLWVIADLAGDRRTHELDLVRSVTTTPATGGFCNGLRYQPTHVLTPGVSSMARGSIGVAVQRFGT